MMTPELLEEAITRWHLESAQVSVDGKREDYETRKLYMNPLQHNYDAMLRAVGAMLDRGIRVTLRCNYDEGNIDGLKYFFEEVSAHFGNPDNLTAYPAMIFQTYEDEKCIDIYRNARELLPFLEKLGLRKIEKSDRSYKLKLRYCGADSGDKSVVIAPDGQLYHCEHLPGNQSFGSIFDQESSVYSDVRANLPANEGCRNCCFLPECTPFFHNACPNYNLYCYAIKEIDTDEKLRRIMMNGVKSPSCIS